MKKSILVLVVIFASLAASAQVPSVVVKVANTIKNNDTRTIVKTVTNSDGNPCMPEGVSYNVELQVKQAYYNPDANKVVYSWETVKTVNIDKDGHEMEVCAE